jgi:large subunit ribosomal protein L24
MKIKTKDIVKILLGKDKGKTGEVLRTLPKSQKVVVKGINMYKRHVKSREGIEGGILSIERPLAVSKVAVLCPITKEPSRVGYTINPDGGKVRIAKKSGADLDAAQKSKAKAKK